MAIIFDRKKYFDAVRGPLFGGALTQQQVDGQTHILDRWERGPGVIDQDFRFLAYELGTTKHETASTMWPIEEYGKGAGQPYGERDPETGQTYYGRGFVQLTWRDNYAKATDNLGLAGADNLELHADRALDPDIAAQIMFRGMEQGWFRAPNKLSVFFSATADDPYGAREIINGDKTVIPSWSGGVSIGNLIAGYHRDFLAALEGARIAAPEPKPPPATVEISTTGDVQVFVNGRLIG